MTFEEFASAHLPAVLRFAAVLAGDRAAAEDLAQEVFHRVPRGSRATTGCHICHRVRKA